MVIFQRRPARGEGDLVAGAILLRRIDRRRAQAIIDRRIPEGEAWAPGYPTDGDLEASRLLLRGLRRDEEPGVFGVYEIIEIGTGLAVGGIGFHRPPGPNGVVEVGYGLVPQVWNRGYATTALLEMVRVAQRNGARRLDARAVPENLASRRVMEKAGLSFYELADGFACYRIDFADEDGR